jgi:hypothetical protein
MPVDTRLEILKRNVDHERFHPLQEKGIGHNTGRAGRPGAHAYRRMDVAFLSGSRPVPRSWRKRGPHDHPPVFAVIAISLSWRATSSILKKQTAAISSSDCWVSSDAILANFSLADAFCCMTESS